jgi:RNA polymerase sigma-70 factor (sigma-E family)
VSEPDGFQEFVGRQSRSLLRTGWLLCGDWPTAEDLVQSALAETWRHWDGLTRPDAPELYTRKVMARTFIRWRRRHWIGEVPTADLPDAPAEHDTYDTYDIVDLRQVLITALDQLTPRQRAVIALRYFDDQTEAQTAAALGCSQGAVKSHASKALARLRATGGLTDMRSEGAR